MKKQAIITGFMLVYGFVSAQSKQADAYYKQGAAAFGNKDYAAADSLFTLSNKLEPHKDTYYSRAVCRLRLGNKNGYCEDLAYATGLGDKEAYKLFWTGCGSTDTTYLSRDNKPSSRSEYIYKEILYKSAYTKTNSTYKYNKENSIIGICDHAVEDSVKEKSYKDTIDLITGKKMLFYDSYGYSALRDYIIFNLKKPKKIIELGLQGQIMARFIVMPDGSIKNPIIIKGMSECSECETEIFNLIYKVPKSIGTRLADKNVKYYYNLLIDFDTLSHKTSPLQPNETIAEFPGGVDGLSKYLKENLKTPVIASKAEISGKAYIKFVVGEDGSIADAFVLKGVPGCPECDGAAIKAVKDMPRWKPATKDGKKIKCFYVIPFNFTIKESTVQTR